MHAVRALTARIQEIDRAKGALFDLYLAQKISERDFEEQRNRNQTNRESAETKLSEVGFPMEEFEELIAFAERLLSHLPDVWNRADLVQKQQIQRAIFPEGIEVTPHGIGTARCALFINHLD